MTYGCVILTKEESLLDIRDSSATLHCAQNDMESRRLMTYGCVILTKRRSLLDIGDSSATLHYAQNDSDGNSM